MTTKHELYKQALELLARANYLLDAAYQDHCAQIENASKK